ncbi:MAG: hypothetical protein Tsb009_21890 [Planctomycetaceae bacterium]
MPHFRLPVITLLSLSLISGCGEKAEKSEKDSDDSRKSSAPGAGNLGGMEGNSGPGSGGGFTNPFTAARSAAQRMQVRNNLRQIGLAMHNYHDINGSFPNAPKRGKGLSWRVHLLPYLEMNNLYRQFKLDEPWDSPHNKQLIAHIPKVYQVPSLPKDGKTTLHTFVGPGTPFGEKFPLTFFRIVDGSANTIAVIEGAPSTAVEWTKPGGLPFDPNNLNALKSQLPQGKIPVLLFDGSTRELSADIPLSTLNLLIQHRDNQRVPQF